MTTDSTSFTRRFSIATASLAAACSGLLATPPATAATVAPTVVINEVEASNYTLNADEDGSYGDWIELYNSTSAAVDLTGWGLSNNAKSPFRWVFGSGTTIAAKGYLRVWADKKDRTASTAKLHTNFNLDNGSDSVVLSAPNNTATGTLVDSTTPVQTLPNYSWCRMPSATGSFTVCLTPTMGAANTGGTTGAMLATPVLSLKSGRYATAQSLTVTGPVGATLRYTTDGTAPTATSTVFPTSLPIAKTTVVRVAAFATGRQRSQIATGTYISDPTGKYAGQRAIYVTMTPADAAAYNGKGASGATGWDSNVQLLGEDGASIFNAPAQTASAGDASSRKAQFAYPMDIKFKDALGASEVDGAVFDADPGTTSFGGLRLRDSGDDYSAAHLRDQFWQGLGADSIWAPSASEPVALFVDGAYRGVMDLREKEDESLVSSSLTGVDKDNVEMRSSTSTTAGDATAADFASLVSFITGNDMSVPANYAKASTMLDMANFAGDFALNTYAGATNWTGDAQMYRALDYDGRWRYRLHDLDTSSGVGGTSATTDPSAQYAQANDTAAMMRALLKSATFKNLYANVIADQLNTIFTPSEFGAKLDSFATPMAKYLATSSAIGSAPTSVAQWNTAVATLRGWPAARKAAYVKSAQTYLGVTTLNALSAQTSDPTMGTVKVNTVDLSTRLTKANPTWTGSYWANVPVTLTAVPKVGYQFTGWSGSSASTSPTITVSAATAGKTYKANYAKLAVVAAPKVTAVAARTGTTDTAVSLQIAATDPNGYALSYKDKGKDLPSGLSLNKATGLIYGRPTRAGSWSSTITVSNGSTSTDVTIAWTIANKLNRIVALPAAGSAKASR